jgi:tol-pal system beta propeller repeat protein TolB
MRVMTFGRTSMLLALVALVCATARIANSATTERSLPNGGGTGRIAYACEVDYRHALLDICTSKLDGSARTRITRSAMNEFDPSWSPNGKRIAFRAAPTGQPAVSSLADIVLIGVDGGGRRNLTNSPRRGNWSPAWSPNGSWIAYATEGPDVWRMHPDGRGRRKVTTGGGEYPAWSPDGKQLAFMSSRTGDYEIYTVRVDGSDLRRLTNNAGQDGWPAWSPDGTKIAFERERGPSVGLDDIYVMDADGGNVQNLTKNAGDLSANYPDWSPNGAYLLFSAYHQRDGGGGGVFVMGTDGTGPRQLIKGGVSPVWQPAPGRRPMMSTLRPAARW